MALEPSTLGGELNDMSVDGIGEALRRLVLELAMPSQVLPLACVSRAFRASQRAVRPRTAVSYAEGVRDARELRLLLTRRELALPRDDPKIAYAAAVAGNLESLKVCKELGCPIVVKDVWYAALRRQFLDVLAWLLDTYRVEVTRPWYPYISMKSNSCKAAASFGALDSLKWLVAQGVFECIYEAVLEACEFGETDTLRWLLGSHLGTLHVEEWGEDAVAYAAQGPRRDYASYYGREKIRTADSRDASKQLECLQLLSDADLPRECWTIETTAFASACGDLVIGKDA